jgi:hypothetical protein
VVRREFTFHAVSVLLQTRMLFGITTDVFAFDRTPTPRIWQQSCLPQGCVLTAVLIIESPTGTLVYVIHSNAAPARDRLCLSAHQ